MIPKCSNFGYHRNYVVFRLKCRGHRVHFPHYYRASSTFASWRHQSSMALRKYMLKTFDRQQQYGMGLDFMSAL